MTPSTDTLKRIIDWATGDDTGCSSNALCRHMMGFESDPHGFMAQSDADDRGRCIRLLNKIPEWWDRLDEMEQLPSHTVTCFGKNGVLIPDCHSHKEMK